MRRFVDALAGQNPKMFEQDHRAEADQGDPADQFRNLYLGPIDNTPAGRAVSMVDLAAPDLATYPRFADAMASALVADLEPGDALYIPSLWYHHVEASAPFNVLINYWWRDTPRTPVVALCHHCCCSRKPW